MVKRQIRVRKKKQNRLAMLLVTVVIVSLMVVAAVGGRDAKAKLAEYKERERVLTEQVEEEKRRKEELVEFEKYVNTKKYKEEMAREKLGLVYEDEIIIKTED